MWPPTWWPRCPVQVTDLGLIVKTVLSTVNGTRVLSLVKYFLAVIVFGFRYLLPNIDVYQCATSYQRVDVFYLNRLTAVGLLIAVAYYLMVIFSTVKNIRPVLVTFSIVELSIGIVCAIGIGNNTLSVVWNSLSLFLSAILGLVLSFYAFAHEKSIHPLNY